MQVFLMFNAITQYTGTHMKVQLQDTPTQDHNNINVQEEDHVLMATTPQDAQNFAGTVIYLDAAWTNGTGSQFSYKIMCTGAKTTRRITRYIQHQVFKYIQSVLPLKLANITCLWLGAVHIPVH
jgi:hypothetical protein